MAEDLLSHNTHNRNPSMGAVARYTAAMIADEWKMNGETIKISKSGEILDGQHRLMAIVRSGKTIQALVCYDVPASVVDTIDIGKKRSFSNWLQIQGEINTATLSSALAGITLYEKYFSKNQFIEQKKGSSFAQLESTLEAHPSLRKSVSLVNGNWNRNGLFNPSLLSVAHYLFSKASPDDAEEFFSKLISGAGLTENSPILAMRNAGLRWKNFKSSPPLYETLGCMIHAWNAFLKRENKKMVRFSDSDPYPKILGL